MYYRAHHGGTKCRKKVQEVSGHQGVFSCKCGATDIPTQETALRYMVRICLADCTDYEWAVMFEAESLFGKTAQELCDIREKSEEDFMQLVQSLQFMERFRTAVAKVENYQEENGVKLTLFISVNINWEKEHIDRLWKQVLKLETKLEISHEEEWGMDLSAIILLIDSVI